MLKRWSIVAVVAALVVLAAVPGASAAQGGTDRPFKATLTGYVYWEWPGTSPSGCEFVTTRTTSSGNATHMGAVDAYWSHCPEEESYIGDGRLTMVAANGDEVYASYDYPGIDVGSPLTVTGGTGRFDDATGELFVTYEVVPQFFCEPADWNDDAAVFACMDFFVPWPWHGTLTGTISY